MILSEKFVNFRVLISCENAEITWTRWEREFMTQLKWNVISWNAENYVPARIFFEHEFTAPSLPNSILQKLLIRPYFFLSLLYWPCLALDNATSPFGNSTDLLPCFWSPDTSFLPLIPSPTMRFGDGLTFTNLLVKLQRRFWQRFGLISLFRGYVSLLHWLGCLLTLDWDFSFT